MGVLSDHIPSLPQVLVVSPVRTKPSIQVYVAVLPNVVLDVTTVPFTGEVRGPQSTAVKNI